MADFGLLGGEKKAVNCFATPMAMSTFDRPKTSGHPAVLLREQHRMSAGLALAASDVVHDQRLIDAPSTALRRLRERRMDPRGLPKEKVYQDFCFDGEPLLRLDDHVAQAFRPDAGRCKKAAAKAERAEARRQRAEAGMTELNTEITARASDGHLQFVAKTTASSKVSDMALLAAIHEYGDKQKERLGAMSLMLHDRNSWLAGFESPDAAQAALRLNPVFTVGKAKLTFSRGGRFFLTQTRLYKAEEVIEGLRRIFGQEEFGLVQCGRYGINTNRWMVSFACPPTVHNRAIPLGKKNAEGKHWYTVLEPIPRDKPCPWCLAHHPDGDCPLSGIKSQS
ncbi:MAG: hypothetical protein M1826_001719 [Phylliscum demangeonii]|nr:MAG: hypothetical protein M1826_001719 [Phylliscum demangeonii]